MGSAVCFKVPLPSLCKLILHTTKNIIIQTITSALATMALSPGMITNTITIIINTSILHIQISVTSALATMALSPGKIPDPCSRARPSSSSLSFSIMTMMVMMMMVVMKMMMDDHIIVYYEDDNYEDDDDDGEIGCLARLSCWPRMRFANSSVT